MMKGRTDSIEKSQEKQYSCIHCGKSVDSLYKRYSATVLKLTDCDSCHNIADKYVEYDIVIIMIDLVLLQQTAYRHILFNVRFKNFWKLSIILLIMEAFSEFSQQTSPQDYDKKFEHKPVLHQVVFDTSDILFYKICMKTGIRVASFIVAIYISTVIYNAVKSKTQRVSFISVWKTVTLSSFGMFLHLPSLIWEMNKQEIHLFIVSMYVNLSQLLAYTALCSCGKFWSVFVIFFSSYIKNVSLDFLNSLTCYFYHSPINDV